MTKRQHVAVPRVPMRSDAMKSLDSRLRLVAPKDVTLLFEGESGTGKEVLARRAHALSPRAAGPFVPLHCAAIPEALLESELFGHERGSFTGATERVLGKVAAADRGTLFLDEVGDIPPAVQVKLLRFLEGHAYMRVGSSTKVYANIRVMCATNRALAAEVAAGRFRSDLWYRIQTVVLSVPPLRERREDIPDLVEQVARDAADRLGVPPPVFSRRALRALLGHAWPGNVRELRNVVERVALLREGKPVRPDDLELPAPVRPPTPPLFFRPSEGLDAIVARAIQAALDESDGMAEQAARMLGVSARTVQRALADGRVVRRRPSEPS